MSTIPDITKLSSAANPGRLGRVGMHNVELPVKVHVEGTQNLIPAHHDLLINVDDPNARGIHMSRLYMTAQTELSKKSVSLELLAELCEQMIATHHETSSEAEVISQYIYPKKVESLKSNNTGWRYYPVTLRAELSLESLILEQTVRITYASTCPCSGALSRQLLQKHFHESFDAQENVGKEEMLKWIAEEANHIATPHSQRSYADVTLQYSNVDDVLDVDDIIMLCETALATPVQAVVKREDEQEFARLCGNNLMFSEDAARRLSAKLKKIDAIDDFTVAIQHLEGLHAHDAIVMTGA